jgi:hypothetical protein
MEKTGDTSSVTTIPRHSGDQNRGKATMLSLTKDNTTVSKENVVNDIDLATDPQEETHECLSGLKLFVTMFCITLAGFLLLLDESVASTAS